MKKQFTLLVFVLMLMVSLMPAAYADAPIEGRAGRAEIRFLEGMTDHHQMALDMASDCLAKATSEPVLSKCQQIIDAQSAEIATMRNWLLEWYNIEYTPMAMENMMGMMSMMEMMGNMPMADMLGMMEGMDTSNMSMMEMMQHMMGSMGREGMGGMQHQHQDMPHQDMPMMMGMMAGLNQLEGVAYEIAWLEAMIDHHDDAIHMAERILQHEVHSETLEMAQQIIDDQTAEIQEMEAMIATLGG